MSHSSLAALLAAASQHANIHAVYAARMPQPLMTHLPALPPIRHTPRQTHTQTHLQDEVKASGCSAISSLQRQMVQERVCNTRTLLCVASSYLC